MTELAIDPETTATMSTHWSTGNHRGSKGWIAGWVLVSLGALPTLVAAQDPLQQWPGLRGPLGNGFAPHAHPPTRFGPDDHLRYRVELDGMGKSTPVIWSDSVFLLHAAPAERASAEELANRPELPHQKTPPPDHRWRFEVSCRERSTGKLRWNRTLVEELPVAGNHSTNGYASSTPITDGRRLFVHYGSYGVHALDFEGKVLWSRRFESLRTRNGWGEAASPALHENTLVVPFDQEDQSFVVALDADTGETLWRLDRDEPTTWATPCILPREDGAQVVLSGTNAVRGYALDDGELLWRCDGQTLNAIPTPMPFRDRVLCMSGYRGACCISMNPSLRGDLRTLSGGVDWEHRRGTPYVPSGVLLDDRLYFTSSNLPLLTCLDADTGEVLLDRHRLEPLGDLYASPLAVAGHLYLFDRGGRGLVLSHPRGGLLEIVTSTNLGEGVDASPAAVDGQLFVRTDQALYCFEEGAGPAPR